jgi:hypothetical protein
VVPEVSNLQPDQPHPAERYPTGAGRRTGMTRYV